MHNQNPSAKFPGGHFTCLLHMSPLWKKKCQILLLPQHRMMHISGKNARNWERCNSSCICRTHLSREIRHWNKQNRDCACAVLFFCHLSTTETSTDDYAKDGGPGAVWPWCSFYLHPLRHELLYLVSYEAHIHKLASNSFWEHEHLTSNRMIWNSKLINNYFNPSAQRLMVKTT